MSHYSFHRAASTTRNKQQQKFCDFVKPLIERINKLQLKADDFEQLKIIGRGAFGQVGLVKVITIILLSFINNFHKQKLSLSLSVLIQNS